MNAVREQLQGGRSGIVLVADIEGLAALDERHGYASGNLVLCELARILGRRGTAGRLGGDALALWAARPTPPRPTRWPPPCAATSTPASAPTA